MNNEKVDLQELELMIQLIQWVNPEFRKVTYIQLTDLIKEEFGVDVKEEDVFLLYEPTIEESIIDSELYYGSMFNLTKEIY